MYQVSFFPGIAHDQGEKVKGEIYSVDAATIKKLDFLEGEGHLFIRKLLKLQLSNKTKICYVYVWNRSIVGVPKVSYTEQPWKG